MYLIAVARTLMHPANKAECKGRKAEQEAIGWHVDYVT